MSEAVAFGAIAVVNRGFTKEVMIHREGEAEARSVLESCRKSLQTLVDDTDTEVPSVLRGIVGVPMEDQRLVGAIAGAVVTCAMRGDERTPALMGALHILIRQEFFCIVAREEGEGTHTTIMPLEATTPEQAQAAFRSHPMMIGMSFMRMLPFPRTFPTRVVKKP